MAGGRNKKLKSLAKPIKGNRSISSRSDEPPTNSNFYLPMELLELILSRLNLKDNIRASVVCKTWLVVATSLRKPNKHPWLMFIPKSGEFYDPETRKTYWLELTELRDCRICCAKDGWLLVFRPNTRDVFFLCPYTQELIKLPKRWLRHQVVAFSTAPTSPNCVIFTVKHITNTNIAISTCRLGETKWDTGIYQSNWTFGIYGGIYNKIVFCRGHFYCLSLTGVLGIYDPDNRTWVVIHVPQPKCTEDFPASGWCTGKFMTEHNGDIFVVYTCPVTNPFIYKLDETAKVWQEVVALRGMTFFANSLSSVARGDVHGKMRDIIYFSKVIYYGKRCVTYSPNDRRYYPQRQLYNCGEQDGLQNIWIDPPDEFESTV